MFGFSTFREKQAKCLRPIVRTGCPRSLWIAGFQPALGAADFQSAGGHGCQPHGPARGQSDIFMIVFQ